MSLGVYLRSAPLTEESVDDPVFGGNVTHNLKRMADAAGIYRHLWYPEELGITRAQELIEPLREGLARMKADPEPFEALNPANGWGSYGGLVRFVAEYLEACEANPQTYVRVNR